MSKIIVPIEMPEACAYCRFRTTSEYIQVGDGLYKRISCCQFAPDWLEDPYRDVRWQMENKEDWCPLEPAEAEDTMTKFERDGVEEYMKKRDEGD